MSSPIESDGTPNRTMVLPRFTIRVLLAMLTLGAVASVVVGMAYRGQTWAWGFSIGLLSLGVIALVHAAWFGIVWLFLQLPSVSRETGESASE